MKYAKKSYWEAFLNDTENIWQATKYLEDKNSGFAPISRVKKDDNELDTQNEKKIAAILISSFFLSLSLYFAL